MAAFYDPGSTASNYLRGAEVHHVAGATIIVVSYTATATTTAFWGNTHWEGWERREPRRLELPELATFTAFQKCLARKLTFRTYVRQIPRGKPGQTRCTPRAVGARTARRKEMQWRPRGLAKDP